MKFPLLYHPDYVMPLPPGHRFPMGKYKALRDYLVGHKIVDPSDILIPEPAEAESLNAAHEPSYVEAVLSCQLSRGAEKILGLPMSEALVRRTKASNGGTILAAELAMQHGIACNLAGGSHHAFREKGSGFCVFNDVAVASTHMLNTGQANSILIIDLDVHQGDGTAAMLAGEQRCFTFSVHCRTNFPATKQQSSLDISLDAGTGDQTYLKILSQSLAGLLDARRPDLVFYNAGVDSHQDDRLGRLSLSDDGLRQRDAFVTDFVLGANIPMVCVLGGGYSHDVNEIAARHAILHRLLKER